MAVKIRLMRIGAKGHPFYRVVAIDQSKKRNGTYLELLGTYNPLTTPKEINLRQEAVDKWLKLGAQPSDGFLRIIGKAKQKPLRKPKKAPAEVTPEPTVEKEAPAETAVEEVAPATQETATETPPTENAAPEEAEAAETPASEDSTPSEAAPTEEEDKDQK